MSGGTPDGSGGWRLVVDRTRCQGYANCLDAAPGALTLDHDDLAVPTLPWFPAGQEAALERAVLRCPVNALQMEAVDTLPDAD